MKFSELKKKFSDLTNHGNYYLKKQNQNLAKFANANFAWIYFENYALYQNFCKIYFDFKYNFVNFSLFMTKQMEALPNMFCPYPNSPKFCTILNSCSKDTFFSPSNKF